MFEHSWLACNPSCNTARSSRFARDLPCAPHR